MEAFTTQRERVEAERRERRESAEDADNHQRADRIAPGQALARQQTAEQADGEGAADVDGENAPGESRGQRVLMNDVIDRMASHGAECSANADEQVGHGQILEYRLRAAVLSGAQ